MPLSTYERERFDRVSTKVASHEERLNTHDGLIEKKVSQEAFLPVKLFVYGLIGTVGAAILGAILRLILLHGGT